MRYSYVYDSGGSFERGEDEGYDEETRRVMTRNAANSMAMDPQRATMGPTASQLRARALGGMAATNGHGNGYALAGKR